MLPGHVVYSLKESCGSDVLSLSLLSFHILMLGNFPQWLRYETWLAHSVAGNHSLTSQALWLLEWSSLLSEGPDVGCEEYGFQS